MKKKDGLTRKDFFINIDNVSIEEDLLRRDLTINAIAFNLLERKYIDPFNGIEHLQNKIADNVSDAFAEDTLRVYRTARFISRFDLKPSDKLVNLCRNLIPTDISNERVGQELYKTMKQAIKPSLFFKFLKDIDWLHYHFNELKNLIQVAQSPIYHPEGDAFEHTLFTIDESNDWLIRTVMLCHDLGKSETTTIDSNGKIQAIEHELASIRLLKNMLTRISFKDKKVIEQVCCLVKFHMIHTSKVSDQKTKFILLELFKNNLTYNHLVEVCRCDVSGRPPLEKYTPNVNQDYANSLTNNDLIPVVNGDMLKEIGLLPCKEYKDILNKCLELQFKGILTKTNWKKVLKGCNFLVLKNKL